jgi:hypothetical protein
MSKPLSPYVRLDLARASPGTLVKSTVRMGLYWLCTTVLIWPSLHSLAEWRPLTVLYFLAATSLVVPTLGYLSLLWRGYGGDAASSPSHRVPPSVTHALSQTAIIAVEFLVVVLAATTLERLLF